VIQDDPSREACFVGNTPFARNVRSKSMAEAITDTGYQVLKKRCDNGTRVRLTPIVHSVLQYFGWLATDIVRRPTRISELIPTRLPATLGAKDTSGIGAGGVHLFPLPNGRV
jgi:hypothetical protein